MKTRQYEGVTYYRYRLTFKSTDGKRHRVTHWSPGHPWFSSEVTRRLNDRSDVAEGARVVVAGPS
jgi:hypothetical protein